MMLNKKILLGSLCAASLLSTQAFANNWDGFYVAGGLQLVDFSQEIEEVAGGSSFENEGLEETTSGVNSFGAELALGYGLAFSDSPWALDFEVFYQETSAEIETPITNRNLSPYWYENQSVGGATSHTLDNTFGARIKPGYFIAPNVKIFMPLGIVQSSIDSEYTLNHFDYSDGKQGVDLCYRLMAVPGYGCTTIAEESETEEAIGFQVGLGLEAMLNEDVSLAVSVMRTFYDEYSVDLVGAVPYEGGLEYGEVPIRYTYDPSVTTGAVTVIYRF